MYVNSTKYNIEYEFLGREQEVKGTRKVMTISENAVSKVESLKYLRSFVQKNGGFDKVVKHMIKCRGGSSEEKHLVFYAIR